MHRDWTLSLTLLVSACAAAAAPASETLPKLRAAIEAPVSSAEQNQQNSKLAWTVSENKQVHGMTRDALEAELGKGDPCSRHPICEQKGFFDNDVYYEVGTEGEGYVRHRPALIVGFNHFGKVERTFVLKVE